MRQFFRWQGLVAFVVITTGGAALWLLLADTLVKMSVESVGTTLAGAEVNLSSADLSLDPLAVRFTRLQVTDPNAPAQNAVEIAQATASIETWPLLMGQLIINDLSITGLQLNTPRSHPGRVAARSEESSADKEEPSMLQKAQAELPPVKEVLGGEQLLVTSRAEALRAGYTEEQARVDKAIAALPNETTRQQLQQRYQRAAAAKPKNLEEFNTQKRELEQVQKEIRAIQSSLEQGRDQIAQSRKKLQVQLDALKSAPGEDVRRLSAKYALSPEGGLNITRLLFGDKAGSMAADVLYWYHQIAPYMQQSNAADEAAEKRPERAQGRYIRFPSNDPLPDFLLRKAQIQASLPFGTIEGRLADLTHQPAIIGRPTTLSAAGAALTSARGFKLDASFDHINPDQPKDRAALSLKGLKFEQLTLSDKAEFPLTLAKATSDINATLTLQGKVLKANFDGQFNGTRFDTVPGEGLAGEIATALASVDQFGIKAEISGTLDEPKVKFSSDLDKQLSAQLNQRLKAKQAEFEQALRSELTKKIAGPQQEGEQQQAQLQTKQKELEQQIAENKKMLEAKVQGYKEGASKAVQDKLKGLKF
ncbi:MAG: TIGR03545 family protein [Chromatiales bacterium]|nr:TIGR03545 family protein [Chromatiales bacterium]